MQAIVLYENVTESDYSIVATPWKILGDCVEKFVSRPNLFLIFPSLLSASAFRRNLAIPNMARLISQGRVKYVATKVQEVSDTLENMWRKTWSLFEPDGDDGWRVLGMFLLISGGTLHSRVVVPWLSYGAAYS